LLNGVIVISKGEGITSTRVVERVKRALKVKKAGHLGTLDPMAKGVLPICVGKATKLAPFLMEHEKEYLATIKLGISTDTYDREGEVLKERPVGEISEETIEGILERFRGEIEQIPPMYSAQRHHGERLYKLARKGEVVERAPKRVVVHRLDLIKVEEDLIYLSICCGKGFYLRTLAHDIGELLGVGGTLWDLVRTSACRFTLHEAIGLDELKALPFEERAKWVIPMADALKGVAQIRVVGRLKWWVSSGNPIATSPAELGAESPKEGDLVKLVDEDGKLVALGELFLSPQNRWFCKPKRVFNG
jgi:tRNA pseudouridine55 synthase